jgi:biofilm PGA synthesis protein PgaD
MRSPIIDRADLQNMQHRTVSGVLTLVFWALWVYLWLPLFALLAWILGIQQAYKYMIVLSGYREVLRLLGIYTLVIIVMGGGLSMWATYNIFRYGDLARRSGKPAPTLEEIARYFRQGSLAVADWQQAQRLYVAHDENGQVAHVDMLTAGTPVPREPNDLTQK